MLLEYPHDIAAGCPEEGIQERSSDYVFYDLSLEEDIVFVLQYCIDYSGQPRSVVGWHHTRVWIPRGRHRWAPFWRLAIIVPVKTLLNRRIEFRSGRSPGPVILKCGPRPPTSLGGFLKSIKSDLLNKD